MFPKPLPGTDGSGIKINGCSLPFFANANFVNNPTDYSSGGANNQTIAIPSGHDYAWAFYGAPRGEYCFFGPRRQTLCQF